MNLIEQFIDLEELSQFHFLLEIALILVAVKIAGHLSKKFGQPAVFGELLVGVILGPSLLGWVQQSDMLRDLAEIGVILLMFLAGLETDVNEFKRPHTARPLRPSAGWSFPCSPVSGSDCCSATTTPPPSLSERCWWPPASASRCKP